MELPVRVTPVTSRMEMEGFPKSMIEEEPMVRPPNVSFRSEEHTSELQSLRHLVCRLLLEKKICSTPGRGIALPRLLRHRRRTRQRSRTCISLSVWARNQVASSYSLLFF